MQLPDAPRTVGTLCLVLLAALLGAGCRDATPTDIIAEEGVCPQTYEFGNYGCAVVVARPDAPALPWPAVHRIELTARPARENSGVGPTGSPESPLNAAPLGPMSVRVTAWSRPMPIGADTLSMWVVARMIDMSPPIVAGRTLPTFAADSVLRLVRFVPAGERYAPDTVRLALRPPAT